MQFEHLIEINDFNNPAVTVITREQLWRGLVLRAESPKLFVPHLEESTIVERTETTLTRHLNFGNLRVNDLVTLAPLHYVHYEVPAQQDIPNSHMRMTIEEPTPEALFVRFVYDDGHSAAEDKENEMYNGYRKAAYLEADIDTVRVIRDLAEQGLLPTITS
jgi:Domain of unknown function (DUF1857)